MTPWTARKLEDLRAKYPANKADTSHPLEFKAAIETIFSGTDRPPKPYEGVASFPGAPLRFNQHDDLADQRRIVRQVGKSIGSAPPTPSKPQMEPIGGRDRTRTGIETPMRRWLYR